jgi:hypothetical protein
MTEDLEGLHEALLRQLEHTGDEAWHRTHTA